MSNAYESSNSIPRTGPLAPLAADAGRFVKNLAAAAVRAHRCRKTIAVLHGLDDERLYDIGLTRSGIETAVDRLVRGITS